MSNNWFEFKRFMIRQDNTAMKVGTDGVLLGAWTNVSACQRILDIGTGTGLIALMLAQRSDAFIDAIEIDSNAAKQAYENVKESPWAEKIKVHHISFQEYKKSISNIYDLIVCNPPFYSDSLKSGTNSRNLARHDEKLSLEELISGSSNLLKPLGRFCIILPSHKESIILNLSGKYNLYPSKIARIRPVQEKPFKRIMVELSATKYKTDEEDWYIEKSVRHQYSEKYTNLTRDFYL